MEVMTLETEGGIRAKGLLRIQVAFGEVEKLVRENPGVMDDALAAAEIFVNTVKQLAVSSRAAASAGDRSRVRGSRSVSDPPPPPVSFLHTPVPSPRDQVAGIHTVLTIPGYNGSSIAQQPIVTIDPVLPFQPSGGEKPLSPRRRSKSPTGSAALSAQGVRFPQLGTDKQNASPPALPSVKPSSPISTLNPTPTLSSLQPPKVDGVIPVGRRRTLTEAELSAALRPTSGRTGIGTTSNPHLQPNSTPSRTISPPATHMDSLFSLGPRPQSPSLRGTPPPTFIVSEVDKIEGPLRLSERPGTARPPPRRD